MFLPPAQWGAESERNKHTKILKYLTRYGFLLFAGKFRDKYGKKVTDTATKIGFHAAKTVSKRVAQKATEATGDLIGRKIADAVVKSYNNDKTTSVTKGNSKDEIPSQETPSQEIYIPIEKNQQIIDLRLFS